MRALMIALLALPALALAACGGDDSGGGSQSSAEIEQVLGEFAPVTKPPGGAAEGGTLEVIASGDVDYIDTGAMYYQFSYMIQQATHRTLVGWPPEETEEPQPDLAAEEPEISEDGESVTFTIRDGVEFSPPVDREVTAADVEYAIERSLLPGVANSYVPVYMSDIDGFDEALEAVKQDETVAPDIKGVTATDDTTLEITLTKPTAAVVEQALSLPVSAPVPEEYAKEFDAENPSTYGQNQVATGPYMIENNSEGEAIGYEPGKSIHLVRNPNWDPETDFRPAFVDEIQVTEGFTDVNSATRKILSGDSQVNGDILPEPEGLKLAAQDYPDQLQLVPGTGNRYISMNTTVPPFDDINVRKAVIAAANREDLRLERGGELVGPIATHFLQPTIPGFEEAGGLEGDPNLDFIANPEGDPEVSEKYFREAGYESGKYAGDEELLMVAEHAGVDGRIGEATLNLFEELGFDVTFRQVNGDIMYTKFCNRPDAEVAVCPNVGWLKDFNDGQSMLDPTFSGNAIAEVNNSNWPELDVPEINDAISAAALVNDPDERARAWGEIDTMIMEQAPAIPYVWDNQPNVYSADVNAVMNVFNGQTDLAFTSIDGEASGS
ncbi:MAG: ABC transporter substrate-binding protein [Solirubrobacterales bacterium]